MFLKMSSLFLTALLLTALPAQARNGYFGVRGGISDVHEKDIVDEYVSGGFGSGYIGFYSGAFRGEVEYTYISRADYDDNQLDLDADFQRVMANAYVDAPITRYVRPYLGGGVGTAIYSVKDNLTHTKESGSNFAWNATAGLGIKLTRNLTFDSGYRYVDMGKVELGEDELHFVAHEVYAGMRFLF